MKVFLILIAISTSSLCFAFEPIHSTNAKQTAKILKEKIIRTLEQGRSLKVFYASLGREYGGRAVEPLIEIANDTAATDETRWAALFGLARIAGKQSMGVIKKFMTNSSWMLRDAALKTAAALDAHDVTPQIEKRLKDDALIVRTTAVQTIAHLKLKGSAPKLVDALFDPANYVNGKGLWIHKYILQAIEEFKYTEAAPKLVELLQKSKDEDLQNQVVQTLEHLTGKSFGTKPMNEQIYLWKRNLVSDATF